MPDSASGPLAPSNNLFRKASKVKFDPVNVLSNSTTAGKQMRVTLAYQHFNVLKMELPADNFDAELAHLQLDENVLNVDMNVDISLFDPVLLSSASEKVDVGKEKENRNLRTLHRDAGNTISNNLNNSSDFSGNATALHVRRELTCALPWPQQQMGVNKIYEKQKTKLVPTVCILDTGIDKNNVDFPSNVRSSFKGYSAFDNSNWDVDVIGHVSSDY